MLFPFSDFKFLFLSLVTRLPRASEGHEALATAYLLPRYSENPGPTRIE
jgi:hypothetical protein